MNYSFLRPNSKWELINSLGLLLVAITFVFIHFKSKPAQTQLTYLVWLLPFFAILPIKKIFYVAEIKLLFFTLFIFFSSVLTYSFMGEVFEQSFRSHWTYLLSFGVLAVLTQIRISKYYLLILIISSLVFVAYDVIIEYLYSGSRGANTHGKPIFYGNIALTTGLVSLILSRNKKSSIVIKSALLIASAAGIVGSIWSQTRGGWIFLVIFSIYYFYNMIIEGQKKSYVKGILVLSIFIIVPLSLKDKIEPRLNQAYTNVENYFVYDQPYSSIGLRFEFWKVSINQFLDSPILGTARSGFLEKKEELIDDGFITKKSLQFEHAHSDFFWTLGSKGLLGIITLYGFYGFLLHFYYTNRKDKRVRLYSLSGITIVSSYIVYGLSESFFSMKLGIGYFIIINLILVRLISQEKEETPFFLCRDEK